MRAEFCGEVAGELEGSRFRDVISADRRRAAQAADRGDNDDRPLFSLDHLRRNKRNQPVIGDDIVVEIFATCVIRDSAERTEIWIRGRVAYEIIHPAETRI